MRNRLKTGSEKSGKKAVSPSLPDKYVSSFLQISQQLKHAFNVMEKHIPENGSPGKQADISTTGIPPSLTYSGFAGLVRQARAALRQPSPYMGSTP